MGNPAKKKIARPRLSELLRHALSPGQLYVLVAAVLVLANARLFYGSLKLQTEHVHLWFQQDAWENLKSGVLTPSWSAPLDDVFIHFDFARSAAHGNPFEWTPGNGYSSGGTSLLYPFVLALGYLLGSTSLSLMHFAALVACVATFGLLLSVRGMFRELGPHYALLAPLFLLSTGALNWTLFSGMEVAFFLALFGLVFFLWDRLMSSLDRGEATRAQSLCLGLASGLLVAGRPEAAPIVAILGFWSAGRLLSPGRRKSAIICLLLIGTPGALVVGAQMTANYLLTGSSSAAGALAKLEMHHPYLTTEQVWAAWRHFVSYQFLRLTHYHFSSIIGPGYIPWVLALMALAFPKTRRPAILLWLCVAFWICLVALNGQVRWQNERYTMPAVAWLLLAAALGAAGAVDWVRSQHQRRALRTLVPLGVLAASLTFGFFQQSRFREQLWFFGRASRNILEQHVRAGAYLGHSRNPRPHRILLSDAGALPYAAQIPGIDLIGLGGYEGLPLAGASRQGVGAAIELLEHLPREQRPDIMALYPHWWPTLVLWFGRFETEFNVRGNVICGGASKVIYSPVWTPLEQSGLPFSLGPGEVLKDEIDVADLISEKEHALSWNLEAQGYVDMKMLTNPKHPEKDLWDAGRLLSSQMTLTFTLKQPAETLLLRVAPAQPAKVALDAQAEVTIQAGDEWQEVRIPLEPGRLTHTLRVTQGEIKIYHLFATSTASNGQAIR